MIASDDLCKRDIGTFGKDRMIFKKRAEAREIVGVDVVDPEDRKSVV